MTRDSKLPDGWQILRFDQFAENIAERVDPAEADVEYYVGLEHLDPESLKIRRWGTPNDVKGTKLRFRKGDIIFGRRRFYQRKVAVTEFDGICSAHAMVLRARESVMLQDLLPFFLQSETFFQRAMQISVGSLSPTINWRTLARQEFAIPSLDEQRRIAEILWAVDAAVVKTGDVVETLRTLQRSTMGQSQRERAWPTKRLRDVIAQKPEYGINAPAIEYNPVLPRFVRITDIDEYGQLSRDDLVSVDVPNFDVYLLEEGDFLFARTGNTVGKTYLYRSKDGLCVYAGYLIRFSLNEELMLPEFLFYFTKSTAYDAWIKRTVRIGAQPNINATEYSNMLVPVPPIQEQKEIVEILSDLKTKIQAYTKHLQVTSGLKKRLVNDLLSHS